MFSKARMASSRTRATKSSATAAQRFTPFLVTLAFFILICNLIGLIPGFESPTAVPIVPLGCAICAFIYYHVQGIRKKEWDTMPHISWGRPMPACLCSFGFRFRF